VIVRIDLTGGEPRARLDEPDDFTSFKIVLVEEAAPAAERLAAAGVARWDEHAWVKIDTIRELAGSGATASWEASLASMLEFARTRGWVDDDLGAVRAHVERPGPPDSSPTV
jgi:hypothetical protein